MIICFKAFYYFFIFLIHQELRQKEISAWWNGAAEETLQKWTGLLKQIPQKEYPMLFLKAASTPYVDGQDLIVWSMTIRVLADTPPWRETNALLSCCAQYWCYFLWAILTVTEETHTRMAACSDTNAWPEASVSKKQHHNDVNPKYLLLINPKYIIKYNK